MILKPIPQIELARITGIPSPVLSQQIYRKTRPLGKTTIKRLANHLPFSEDEIGKMSPDEIYTELMLKFGEVMEVKLAPGECMKAALA